MTKSDSINPFKDDMTGKLLLGRYRIVRRLAAGGMGVVYLARSEGAAGFVKPVVVKLILPVLASSEEFSGMFAREARILANLRHPNIVGIVEFAEEQDCNIMVLEYVHGFQLGQWKKYLGSQQRVIPTAVAIHIVINVLDALHYAHMLKSQAGDMQQIIHRDISPGNVMIDLDGHVKLVDFGIAFAEENTEGYKTMNKSFKGKLSYSAPELFANKKATVQSDIYSCGVTLHEILIGKNEFNFRDHASIVNAVLNHVPTSVHASRDDAPERIDEVIWKAMAKNPEHRYKTASAFADDLRDILDLPGHRAQAMLTELVQHDFEEPMSSFLRIESLASRERAWRTPSVMPQTVPAKGILENAERPTDAPLETSAPSTRSDVLPEQGTLPETTVAPRSVVTGEVAGMQGIKTLLYAIVALLVLTVAGIGAFLFTRPAPKTANQFELVYSQLPGTAADTADTPATTPDAEQGAPERAEETAVASDGDIDDAKATDEAMGSDEPAHANTRTKGRRSGAKKAPGGPDLARLTGAFRKKKNKIHGCFQSHQTSVDQSQNVSVLFTVGASGGVQQVQLSPQNLVGTALGDCLLGVSKSTVFPPQTESISFRIPLSAKRVKN